MSRKIDIKGLLEKMKQGDRFALSKAITLVESTLALDQKLAAQLMDACLPSTGNKGIRIGISGPPGVGKSSFIEALGMHIINSGLKLAVLAIDPSSTVSRGSILADKTRMASLSSQKAAYIRPTPSGESLGGVAKNTREASILCQYSGYDIILIETVGVGQSETAVSQMVDCFVLLLQPGAGDEIQGIKRGILELADIILVNKADATHIELARKTKSEFSKSLRLFPPKEDGTSPSVHLNSSYDSELIIENWNHIENYIQKSKQSGNFKIKRTNQNAIWFDQIFESFLKSQLFNSPKIKSILSKLRLEVSANKRSISSALEVLKEELTG